jgi:hypothetical protein
MKSRLLVGVMQPSYRRQTVDENLFQLPNQKMWCLIWCLDSQSRIGILARCCVLQSPSDLYYRDIIPLTSLRLDDGLAVTRRATCQVS